MSGIYIHVPFCRKKCFYCDFYSIEELNLFDNYMDTLCTEIKMTAQIQRSKIEKFGFADTVFFGGGTPSLFKPEQLYRIVTLLKDLYPIREDAEWTLEANPGTYDLDLLKVFLNLGINRLSIGVQSFVDEELKFLDRIHSSETAVSGIKAAREAGFNNFSFDLMFSLPGQTIETVSKTLNQSLELNPNHISAYSLIYEPGTPLHKAFLNGEIKKIDDDTDAIIYEKITNAFLEAGYEHYEVSNYAKPGFQSKHNLNYWHCGEYFAFGPSAHGYLNGERYWNVKSLARYYEYIKSGRLPVGGSEKLTVEQKISERIMLGLRADGIHFRNFYEEFGIDLEFSAKNLFTEWIDLGFCDFNNEKIKLNYHGYSILNYLTAQLRNLIVK